MIDLDFDNMAVIASNNHVFAVRDKFPASPGHTLVFPVREVECWSGLYSAEVQSIMDMVDFIISNDTQGADGWNVGWNDGEAAGKTVSRFHVHVIPRFFGDVVDPRGGIRGCIPEKRVYTTGPCTMLPDSECEQCKKEV